MLCHTQEASASAYQRMHHLKKATSIRNLVDIREMLAKHGSGVVYNDKQCRPMINTPLPFKGRRFTNQIYIMWNQGRFLICLATSSRAAVSRVPGLYP